MSIIGDIADVIGEVKNAVRDFGARKTLGGVGKELKDVDARFFERPNGKRHVHILGCTVCRVPSRKK